MLLIGQFGCCYASSVAAQSALSNSITSHLLLLLLVLVVELSLCRIDYILLIRAVVVLNL